MLSPGAEQNSFRSQATRQWAAAACLLLFTLILVIERLHTRTEAFERDIAGYAVIAHEMLLGRNLYSDLWERKPPLLYATFALAQTLFGYGPREILGLNITAGAVTLIALFFAGTKLGESKIAGLFAAFLWLLLGGDLGTQANQPNAEVFVNACLSLAFALLLHWPPRSRILAPLLLGGLLAAATLYKQHVAVTCAALLTAHLLASFCRRSIEKTPAFSARARDVAIAGSVIAAAWISIAAYFTAVGRFGFFFDTLFRQNVAYSGDIKHNLLAAFVPHHLFPEFAPWALVFPPLILTTLILERARFYQPIRIHPNLLHWLAWAAGSAITYALPGKFFGHYYQLWIPLWCLAGGWAARRLLREARPGYRLLNRAIVAAAIGCLLGMQGTQYLLSPEEWTHRKYPVDDFIQQRTMGTRLAALLAPRETFYNLGEDTPLYFYSARSPASGLLYLGPLETGDEQAAYQLRLLADLQRSRPSLIVTSTLRNTTLRKQPQLLAWIRENYTPVQSDLGCPIYRIMVRIDSPLANRLHRAEKTIAALE